MAGKEIQLLGDALWEMQEHKQQYCPLGLRE